MPLSSHNTACPSVPGPQTHNPNPAGSWPAPRGPPPLPARQAPGRRPPPHLSPPAPPGPAGSLLSGARVGWRHGAGVPRVGCRGTQVALQQAGPACPDRLLSPVACRWVGQQPSLRPRPEPLVPSLPKTLRPSPRPNPAPPGPPLCTAATQPPAASPFPCPRCPRKFLDSPHHTWNWAPRSWDGTSPPTFTPAPAPAPQPGLPHLPSKAQAAHRREAAPRPCGPPEHRPATHPRILAFHCRSRGHSSAGRRFRGCPGRTTAGSSCSGTARSPETAGRGVRPAAARGPGPGLCSPTSPSGPLASCPQRPSYPLPRVLAGGPWALLSTAGVAGAGGHLRAPRVVGAALPPQGPEPCPGPGPGGPGASWRGRHAAAHPPLWPCGRDLWSQRVGGTPHPGSSSPPP